MNYKDFWDVQTDEEAYLKVVGAPQEDSAETEECRRLLLDGLNVSGAALEIGAGYGRMMKVMAPYFDVICGAEISSPLVAKAVDYLWKSLNCVPITTSDGQSILEDDNAFDFVYSIICFQHMPTLEIVQSNIREIYRVLTPGGVCRIQTILGDPVDRSLERATGDGRNFPSGEDFLKEFTDVGFRGTVEVGLHHFQWIWVTAYKP